MPKDKRIVHRRDEFASGFAFLYRGEARGELQGEPVANNAADPRRPREMNGGPQIGGEFAGYRIDSRIGRGGMSVVYLATHLRLARRVALKIPIAELLEDDKFRERFVRESRLASAIDHPNIVPIYEANEVDGWPFIAMRYIDGTDLKTLIDTDGRLEPARALSILSQVASALDAAHRAGLTHRDVKPGNVLIVPRSEAESTDFAYLADFGLTKHSTSQSALTKTGQFVGTIDYVAPEQIEGGKIDGAVDVYALTCVLYECLVGQRPFPKDNDVAVIYAHLLEPPPHPSLVRTELPTAVDEVVARGMAKSTDDRYSTCGGLVAAARAALTAEALRPTVPAPQPTLVTAPQTVPAATPTVPASPPTVAAQDPPPRLPEPSGGSQLTVGRSVQRPTGSSRLIRGLRTLPGMIAVGALLLGAAGASAFVTMRHGSPMAGVQSAHTSGSATGRPSPGSVVSTTLSPTASATASGTVTTPAAIGSPAAAPAAVARPTPRPSVRPTPTAAHTTAPTSSPTPAPLPVANADHYGDLGQPPQGSSWRLDVLSNDTPSGGVSIVAVYDVCRCAFMLGWNRAWASIYWYPPPPGQGVICALTTLLTYTIADSAGHMSSASVTATGVNCP